MAQQTAVEWLWNISIEKELESLDFQKAIEMEKEQIYNAWLASEQWSDGKFLDSKKSFEEYHKETYKK